MDNSYYIDDLMDLIAEHLSECPHEYIVDIANAAIKYEGDSFFNVEWKE